VRLSQTETKMQKCLLLKMTYGCGCTEHVRDIGLVSPGVL